MTPKAKIKVDEILQGEVLVIGGGLAGCVAAITAKMQGGGEVILVDKARTSRSGQSPFAAGIWALKVPQDDLGAWIQETVEGGDYWNDQEWVRLLWERVYEAAEKVDAWGREGGKVTFLRDEQGAFVRRQSRGHHRTWHGVINSLPMMEGLRKKAFSCGVRLVDRLMITELVVEDGRFVGAVGINYWTGKTYLIKAKATVLAAAGSGFKSIFFGHRNLTGDLQAAAYRAGVVLRNMENISHNTCARQYDIHGLNLYVSVGGKWLNKLGEEFMWKYDPLLGNRANQPTKCLALAREVHEGRGPIMFDMSAATPADQALCRKILPESFIIWDRAGIDPFTQQVEWVTSFYGTIINGGGLHIDRRCATNIPGIYAAGDITCIPPHGGYSFGGVNIAFCAVSGLVAGEEAVAYVREGNGASGEAVHLAAVVNHQLQETVKPMLRVSGYTPDEVIAETQQAIIPYRVSLIKNKDTLEGALEKLEGVRGKLEEMRARDLHDLVKANEAKNMLQVAELMIRAALLRRESRGFHFREDYPINDNQDWLKWIMLHRGEQGMEHWLEEIPTPYVQPSQPYTQPRGLRRATA